jgi:hypothetical protein
VELSDIEWDRPWYDAVRPAFDAARAGARIDDFIDAFNANAARLQLANHAGLPVRFVPQDCLPAGTAYEAHIGATGCVPTRANLHDFFNGLVWQTFPRIKRELNALQAAQIAQAGSGRSRGAARDAATIFDENAAVLVVRDGAPGRKLVDDLRAHRWRAALFDARALFGREVELWLFGHALMEKLVAPRKAITAHVHVLFVPPADADADADAEADAGPDFFALPWDARRDRIDRELAGVLRAGGLTTADFTPLPVLGVPGWWPHQDEAFYADQAVFRPPRSARTNS